MDWFIVIVGVVLLTVGSGIALAWWKLVKRAAPYRDESRGDGKMRATGDSAEVIVLPPAQTGADKR